MLSFFMIKEGPVDAGTAAVTVVDGLFQEDAAIAPAVGPAVQPDVPKPEEASTQALSSPTLHSFHCMDKRQMYCNCVGYGLVNDACNAGKSKQMQAHVGNSCPRDRHATLFFEVISIFSLACLHKFGKIMLVLRFWLPDLFAACCCATCP